MSNLRLSVLDQSPVPAGGSPSEALRSSLQLATILDNRGFVRYWFAEHHHSASFAGATPEAAGSTPELRDSAVEPQFS